MEHLARHFMLSWNCLRARLVATCPQVAILLILSAPAAAQQSPPDFVRDIQPILAANCYSCHGPARSMGGIRLDSRVGAFGEGASRNATIVPWRSAASELMRG